VQHSQQGFSGLCGTSRVRVDRRSQAGLFVSEGDDGGPSECDRGQVAVLNMTRQGLSLASKSTRLRDSPWRLTHRDM
jgi:hypothetical protein